MSDDSRLDCSDMDQATDSYVKRIATLQRELAEVTKERDVHYETVVMCGKAMDMQKAQLTAQAERVKGLEGALQALCKEVRSYTTTVHYAGRESCLKDLDRRERLLLDQCDNGEQALSESGSGT